MNGGKRSVDLPMAGNPWWDKGCDLRRVTWELKKKKNQNESRWGCSLRWWPLWLVGWQRHWEEGDPGHRGVRRPALVGNWWLTRRKWIFTSYQFNADNYCKREWTGSDYLKDKNECEKNKTTTNKINPDVWLMIYLNNFQKNKLARISCCELGLQSDSPRTPCSPPSP